MFDPSNYSQNLLTAARALEQINNQLRGLENQARLLINSTKNVTGLPASVAGQLKAHIDEINRLMAQAKGLSFEVEKTISQFETAYPRQYAAAASSDRMRRMRRRARPTATRPSNRRCSPNRRSSRQSNATAQRCNP